MAPKDGKAMMMLTLAPGNSLQEAANGILKQNSLQLLDSKQVTVNGLNAIAMVADVQQQQQQQGQTQQAQQVIRTLSYLIQYGGNIYHILGVSGSNDFNNYAQVFTNTMQSFKELKDLSKINKKPERVHIKTVSKTGTLEQAFRSYKVPDKRLEEFSILNGMKLKDNVTQGTLIKIIEH
jgi:predicted Zn-dependent protease